MSTEKRSRPRRRKSHERAEVDSFRRRPSRGKDEEVERPHSQGGRHRPHRMVFGLAALRPATRLPAGMGAGLSSRRCGLRRRGNARAQSRGREAMTAREHPEWMYSVPDARTAHIGELETALLTSNDKAAQLAAALLEEKKQLGVDRAEALMDTLDILAGVGT